MPVFHRLSPSALVLAGVAALQVLTWGLFLAVAQPAHYDAATGTFGIGLALTAFLLGMRHAFDADHIAAIDNSARKFVSDGRDSSSVGLWFAFGHSTVVLLAVGLVTAGVGALSSQIIDDDSPLAIVTGVWGPSVSALFLLVIAAVNLSALRAIFRRTRQGGNQDVSPTGGIVSRLIAKTGAELDQPWKMYIVGFLFGLGFDTASTISLLLIAGGVGVVMPWYVAMILPLLFTAGMVLGDGANSLITARMYAWSTDRSDHRLRYNVTLLSISVIVALVVGTVGLSGVLVDVLHVSWAPITAAANADLRDFGFIIVGTLLLAWTISWCFARAQRSTATAAR